MADEEYHQALRREIRAQQLAAIRLQRMEQERYEQDLYAIRQLAMERSLGMAHRPGAPLFFLDTPAPRSVYDDIWMGRASRPPIYDSWQSQSQSQQLPDYDYADPVSLRLPPPPPPIVAPAHVAPMHSYVPPKDFEATLERNRVLGVSRVAQQMVRPTESERPLLPVLAPRAPSPARLDSKSARSKVKGPASATTTTTTAVTTTASEKSMIHKRFVDSKAKTSKRERPAPVAKPTHSVLPKKTSSVATRHNWDELELGKLRGTPAYNAYQSEKHKERGSPPPKELKALDLARKVQSMRVKSLYLPDDTPFLLQQQNQQHQPQGTQTTTDLHNGVIDCNSENSRDGTGSALDYAMAANQMKAKRKRRSSSDMDLAMETMGAHLQDKEIQERSRGSLDGDVAEESQRNFVSENGQNIGQKSINGNHLQSQDHSALLRQSLSRLHQIMRRQDEDDYSTQRQQSNDWTVDFIKTKLKSMESEITELDAREKQVIKESKQLNGTNREIMDEAYRLLGIVPPKGC